MEAIYDGFSSIAVMLKRSCEVGAGSAEVSKCLRRSVLACGTQGFGLAEANSLVGNFQLIRTADGWIAAVRGVRRANAACCMLREKSMLEAWRRGGAE